MTKSNLELLRTTFLGEKRITYDDAGNEYVSIVSNYIGQKRYLHLAIEDKIKELRRHLKIYPEFIFWLPGIASMSQTQAKIKALEALQTRIICKNTDTSLKASAFCFSALSDDVLDGETLELFKFAIHVYRNDTFTPEEFRNILHRSPPSRIARDLGM